MKSLVPRSQQCKQVSYPALWYFRWGTVLPPAQTIRLGLWTKREGVSTQPLWLGKVTRPPWDAIRRTVFPKIRHDDLWSKIQTGPNTQELLFNTTISRSRWDNQCRNCVCVNFHSRVVIRWIDECRGTTSLHEAQQCSEMGVIVEVHARCSHCFSEPKIEKLSRKHATKCWFFSRWKYKGLWNRKVCLVNTSSPLEAR